jgi:hypothetical protein
MYFFVLPLVIGLYECFRNKSKTMDVERFFVPAFIVLNVIMMISLYINYGYISRRHCLPLVVFTIFYVPIGLQVLATWLGRRFFKKRVGTKQNTHVYFFALLAIGMALCLPKLFRPMRIEKQGYRAAANWLKENTASDELIVVPDCRISFYAQRNGFMYESGDVPKQAKYIVIIVKSDGEEAKFVRIAKEQYSVWVNGRQKSGKRLVIYRMM